MTRAHHALSGHHSDLLAGNGALLAVVGTLAADSVSGNLKSNVSSDSRKTYSNQQLISHSH